ncbi:eEF1-gamma domain-containing protein [Salix suchowensis]|nr:eEF1-gamma domain-containing protein [Salix suchowensis]
MSSAGTIWTIPQQAKGKLVCPIHANEFRLLIDSFGFQVRAVATFAGINFELPASYTHYETNKQPEFLSKFPHGKIPAWEGADGFNLFEELLLRDIFHTAASERALRALKTLDAHLLHHTFFVGERISLADLAVAVVVQRAVTINVDAEVRAQLPNLIRHLETIVNQPQLKDIFGPLEYTEKALQYVPPPKEKKETKPAAAAPKAPKAEKKPKKEDDDEEDEPLVPAEPKVKNPLDDLPKSTLNLEDWKRAYSNKETRGVGGALEWFYEKYVFRHDLYVDSFLTTLPSYDKEGYSVWRVDFKYNDELTQTFMSSNQIGGFFNRLEASRKYLFGSMGVLGVANDSVISGAFILRGQDFKPVVDVAPIGSHTTTRSWIWTTLMTRPSSRLLWPGILRSTARSGLMART